LTLAEIDASSMRITASCRRRQTEKRKPGGAHAMLSFRILCLYATQSIMGPLIPVECVRTIPECTHTLDLRTQAVIRPSPSTCLSPSLLEARKPILPRVGSSRTEDHLASQCAPESVAHARPWRFLPMFIRSQVPGQDPACTTVSLRICASTVLPTHAFRRYRPPLDDACCCS
jgi:hypothetical protein